MVSYIRRTIALVESDPDFAELIGLGAERNTAVMEVQVMAGYVMGAREQAQRPTEASMRGVRAQAHAAGLRGGR
jgi:hypothetical protein